MNKQSQNQQQKGFMKWEVRSNPTLGEYLRDARIRAGATKKQLSKELGISEEFIAALEKSDYEHLPATVYVRGFIRSICSHYQLNSELAIQMYERESRIHSSIAKSTEPQENKAASLLLRISPHWVAAGGTLAIVLVMLGYLWSQFAGLAKPPELVINEPTGSLITETADIIIQGETEEGVAVYVNGQAIPVGEGGFFQQAITLQDGFNALTIVAKNKFGGEQSITREVIANLPDEVVAKRELEPSTQDNASEPLNLEDEGSTTLVELTVNVDDEATWVSVEADGKIAFQGTMLPGSSQQFIANNEVSLTSANATNTSVIFNGNQIADLGTEGTIRDLVFTSSLEMLDRGRLVKRF